LGKPYFGWARLGKVGQLFPHPCFLKVGWHLQKIVKKKSISSTRIPDIIETNQHHI